MEIKIEGSTAARAPFSSTGLGDVFEFKNGLYLKCQSRDQEENALILRSMEGEPRGDTFKLAVFSDGAPVTLKKAKLTIEDID